VFLFYAILYNGGPADIQPLPPKTKTGFRIAAGFIILENLAMMEKYAQVRERHEFNFQSYTTHADSIFPCQSQLIFLPRCLAYILFICGWNAAWNQVVGKISFTIFKLGRGG
jgi:hypothetical protein